MKAGTILIADALSFSCLILLLLSELYSGLDLASDPHLKLPAWEHPVGWALLCLACVQVVGLVLLIRADRRRLGFYVTAASSVLYAAFVCLDAFQGEVELGDWVAMGEWVMFCAVVVGAARFLMVRPKLPYVR